MTICVAFRSTAADFVDELGDDRFALGDFFAPPVLDDNESTAAR
jgi:hypothetical protein